ncbi:MAG: ammonia channel protein [Verrucomicrobiaceae bacterium]|nr:ammonia channel protein [Verrucomicrobiaceae bacterium]
MRLSKRLFLRSTLAAILAVSSACACADTGVVNGANTAWVLTATALVLFMTLPGLALFYAGLVRSKNVLSVMMQCFAIACVSSVLWFVVGYSAAFSGVGAWLGNFDKILLAGVGANSVVGNLPEPVFLMFQMTFAIITPALVIGGFAERIRFSAVLWFSALWLLLVYVPVTHWVWGGGWLGQLGLLDFAGGTVVHITAGAAALVGAIMVGPRRGFSETAMPPHNMTMTVTGAGMLWVGWYGFNAGSALAADGNAGMAMLVTHLSACAGAFTWLCIEWYTFGKPSALGVVTGLVAGLGTITPASGYVGPAGALVIGVSAGFICFFATLGLKRKLKIDDSLDVFPVHGVGGILGTFMAGIFASPHLGVFSGRGFGAGIDSIAGQLKIQLLGIGSIFLYTVFISFVLYKLIDMVIGLRVSADEETEGLDIVQHNEVGYDLR